MQENKQSNFIIQKFDDDLKMSQFSLLVTLAAIPMSILAIFSIQIAKFIGFQRIIRAGMILNPLCIILGTMQQNYQIFAFFNIFLTSVCFGSTVMPILYCLWSHFPTKTGNVTGIALASFGLSTFFYSIIATNIVNPHNIPARIKYTEGSQTYYLFEDEVSMNVPSMGFWLGLIQMFFCIPGSFLISNNENNERNENTQNENKGDQDLELKLINTQNNQEIDQTQQQSHNQYKNIDYQVYEQQDNHEINSRMTPQFNKLSPPNQQFNYNQTTSHQQFYKSNLSQNEKDQSKDKPDQIPDQNFDLNSTQNNNEINTHDSKNPQMTLMQAAKTNAFLIIYFSTMFVSFFSLFLSMNFKTYGLTKINDDHFLTYLVTVCSFFSSLSNIGWGYLVDKYDFRSVYLKLVIAILVFGFIFPYVSSNKFGFFVQEIIFL